ncbi:MAG: HisA/HisF-related TIM barrel protein [Nitrososphaeria archaeon]
MKVFAALDISEGKVVRLKEGNKLIKVYSSDPDEFLNRLVRAGYDSIHIVDIDRALGRGDNEGLIMKLLKRSDIYKQVAGGIRSRNLVQRYIEAGADKVVVGTLALTNPEELADLRRYVTAAVDVADNKVAIRGWRELIDVDPLEMMRRLSRLGYEEFLVTSIERDGSLMGFDRELALRIPESMRRRTILSGGVLLSELQEISNLGYYGCVVGRDIYERLTL